MTKEASKDLPVSTENETVTFDENEVSPSGWLKGQYKLAVQEMFLEQDKLIEDNYTRAKKANEDSRIWRLNWADEHE